MKLLNKNTINNTNQNNNNKKKKQQKPKKKKKRKRKRKKEKEKNILIKMIFTKQFRDLPFTLYPSHIRRYEVYNNVYI